MNYNSYSVKIAIFLKVIYRFSPTPIKILVPFFFKKQMPILKFRWNRKALRKDKTILKKENKVGILTLSDFKTCYELFKTLQYQHKVIHTDQEHSTEFKKNSYIYGQSIFDKHDKTIHLGKNNVFNKCCWKNWMFTSK